MVPEVTTKLLASDLYRLDSTLQTRFAGFDLSNALPIGEGVWLLAPNGPESEMATYTANLCPIHCGGGASHSRLCTTILHSESGHGKRVL